jgi:hypothetical protein
LKPQEYWGNSKNMPKRKEMTAMAKWRNDDVLQPPRPPSFAHHAQSTPKCPVPSSTFKKGNTIDTMLLLGPDRS